MSLNSAFNNAASGIAANSRQAELTATNLANATTENFARREIDLSSVVSGGKGGGVKISAITLAESIVTPERRYAEAALGFQESIASAQDAFAVGFGEPGDPNSMVSRIGQLETSLRELSDTPESAAVQAAAVAAAIDVADGFNALQTDLIAAREEADAEIARQIDFLNATSARIAELNVEITKQSSRGADLTGLMQERRDAIDSMASIAPLEVVARDHGQVAVFTAKGANLVDGGVSSTLVYTPTPTYTADLDYRAAPATPPPHGVTLNGTDVTPGDSNTNMLGGGSLEGLFEVRDGITVDQQLAIDSLARDLITRFSDPAVDPTLAGGDGLFTFDPAGGALVGDRGLAGRFEVNERVDPDRGGSLYRMRDGIGAAAPAAFAGSNTIPVALLGAMTDADPVPGDTGLSGVASVSNIFADFSSLRSTLAQSSSDVQAMRAASFQTLSDTETAVLGVDTDFELNNLTMIQNNFAANARVLQVLDDLFRLILEI